MTLKEDRARLIESRRDQLIEAVGAFVDAKITYALANVCRVRPLGDFRADVDAAHSALSDAIDLVMP